MNKKFQAIRGMNDVLPESSYLWRYLEKIFSKCLSQYHYDEIRFPVLEKTALFNRTIGEITDIVEKEMYTFEDINGDSLTLRPEGTAGCVRACLEHGLLHNQQQKLWYCGPMFRHEKPQKGRYRQFHQFGVEALNISGIGIELELITICKRFWQLLGVDTNVQLQINTLGTIAERQAYRQQLVDFLTPRISLLDEDSKRRLSTNPLRILDSKNPDIQLLLQEAPILQDSLSTPSREHFNSFCAGLDALNISYIINPLLVRGLDYYGHTVFEWVTDKLGSQATVCAGGRYDLLIEQLGGASMPAVGFAMGIERLLLLIQSAAANIPARPVPDVFIITDSEAALQMGLTLSDVIRLKIPGSSIYTHTAGGSFKSQFKKADKSGAALALIIGEEEVANGMVSVKSLRKTGNQEMISQEDAAQYIIQYLQKPGA